MVVLSLSGRCLLIHTPDEVVRREVCFDVQGGHFFDDAQPLLLMALLYGPAVRCKPNVKKWRGLVLRICIRPLHGAFVLLAIMDIRAYPISFSEKALRGR